jgi:hypothetical protein
MDCCKTKEEDGCCKDLDKIPLKNDILKGGNIKMKKNILLWIVIGALFIMALFLVFKAGSVNSGGVQAATNVAKTAASSSGMVGGC